MAIHRFFSKDQTPLVAEDFPAAADAPPAGLVVVVHGYCEHRGRYRDTAAFLTAFGYHVLAGDLRGHGESGGARAHVLAFSEYLDDVDALLAQARRLYPGERPVLLGHSMGGLVSLLYSIDRGAGLRALALSSPFLGLKVHVPAWKQLLGRVASRVRPGLTLPNEVDAGDLSHDPKVGAAYRRDPLVSRVATARWFTEALSAHRQALERAAELRLPLCLLHGGDDRIADPAASREVFDRVAHGDKSFTLYPGLYHEIFNEVERERVLTDLVAWLKAH